MLGKLVKLETSEITGFHVKIQVFMILTSHNHVKTNQNSDFCEVNDLLRNFRNLREFSVFLMKSENFH